MVQHGDRRSSGLVVALLGVTFLGFMATQWWERQIITDVVVNGASGLSRQAVVHVVDTLRARARKTLVLADVRNSVELLPYVKSACVYFSGVRTVTVDVQEREPIAHIMQPDGSLRYLDAEGTVLPDAGERTAHNVPLIGTASGKPLTAAEIQKLVAFIAMGRTTLHSALYQTISEVRLNTVRDCIEVVTDESRWCMAAKNVHGIRSALTDMNVFWLTTAASLVLANVAEIDLRWNHQVVLRYRSRSSRSGVSA